VLDVPSLGFGASQMRLDSAPPVIPQRAIPEVGAGPPVFAHEGMGARWVATAAPTMLHSPPSAHGAQGAPWVVTTGMPRAGLPYAEWGVHGFQASPWGVTAGMPPAAPPSAGWDVHGPPAVPWAGAYVTGAGEPMRVPGGMVESDRVAYGGRYMPGQDGRFGGADDAAEGGAIPLGFAAGDASAGARPHAGVWAPSGQAMQDAPRAEPGGAWQGPLDGERNFLQVGTEGDGRVIPPIPDGLGTPIFCFRVFHGGRKWRVEFHASQDSCFAIQ
jgi:hypothetical protein